MHLRTIVPTLDIGRFDLWSMLPTHGRRENQTGDLWCFIACLQEVTDLQLVEVERFLFDLDELGKRPLASVLVEM